VWFINRYAGLRALSLTGVPSPISTDIVVERDCRILSELELPEKEEMEMIVEGLYVDVY
jgi:hypothetical protein